MKKRRPSSQEMVVIDEIYGIFMKYTDSDFEADFVLLWILEACSCSHVDEQDLYRFRDSLHNKPHLIKIIIEKIKTTTVGLRGKKEVEDIKAVLNNQGV